MTVEFSPAISCDDFFFPQDKSKKAQLAKMMNIARLRFSPSLVGKKYVSPKCVSNTRRFASSESEGLKPTIEKPTINEITERVVRVVSSHSKVDGVVKVSPTSHFQNDLGLDSLDSVEVVLALEEEFAVEIPDHDAEKLLSVPDAVKYLAVRH